MFPNNLQYVPLNLIIFLFNISNHLSLNLIVLLLTLSSLSLSLSLPPSFHSWWQGDITNSFLLNLSISLSLSLSLKSIRICVYFTGGKVALPDSFRHRSSHSRRHFDSRVSLPLSIYLFVSLSISLPSLFCFSHSFTVYSSLSHFTSPFFVAILSRMLALRYYFFRERFNSNSFYILF